MTQRPDEAAHRASVLLETLQSQPGVEGLSLSLKDGRLTVRYDPAQVSSERAEAVAEKVADALAAEREECPARRAGGTCEQCPEILRRSRNGAAVRWNTDGSPGRSLSVRSTAPGEHQREITVSALRTAAARPTHVVGVEWSEILPVAACGFFLAAGWLVGWISPSAGVWCYAASALAGGLPATQSTINSLRQQKLDVDLLMLMGAVGAAVVGHLDESAILLFLFTLSGLLESYALGRTRKALESLAALRPDEAAVLREGGVVRIPLEQVAVGERIVVKPGERIPLDGKIEMGEAEVDESALTGESVPRWKEPGTTVLAGSINLDGALTIVTTKPPGQSTLQRIVDLVENARESRAPMERVFDRFAKFYLALVLISAALTAVVPPLLGLATWSDMFYRSMTLLVVASPCALVISTPATILSAIASAARRGILFKGGAAVESLGVPCDVAFDKTGTLTDGALSVASVHADLNASEDEVLALAAAAERMSEHPLAMAVVREAELRGLSIPPCDSFRTTAGLGVDASVAGVRVLVGSRRFLQAQGVAFDAASSDSVALETGKIVWVAHGGTLFGRVVLGDRLRPEAPAALLALKRLGVRRIAMLTGDERRVAEDVGRMAGVEEIHADLLPEEKVAAIEKMRQEGRRIVMVGDGVNDAPAMAIASVGVAMGAAGADVALEASDVVLMSSNLGKLVEAVELSQRARRVLYQNLLFASGVLIVLVCIAASGWLPLPVGVVGHEGSTLLVVLSGLRLLAWKPRLAVSTNNVDAASPQLESATTRRTT